MTFADEQIKQVKEYYKKSVVRDRIHEFTIGAVFYITSGRGIGGYKRPKKLSHVLDNGWDLSRSLRDYYSNIFSIDLEAVHTKFEKSFSDNPLEVLKDNELTYNTLTNILDSAEIKYMSMLTGKGTHIITKVEKDSELQKKLILLGDKTPETVISKSELIAFEYSRDKKEEVNAMKTYYALGKITHYLETIIRERMKSDNIHNLVSTDFKGFYEKIRIIDRTSFGDPLFRRSDRVLGSSHQKAIISGANADNGKVFITLPLMRDMKIEELLEIREDYKNGYSSAAALLEDYTDSMPHINLENFLFLLDGYLKSDIKKFHDLFENHKPTDIQSTATYENIYNLLVENYSPGCVFQCLKSEYHNTSAGELLKNPNWVLLISGVLVSLGVHPKHIATVIRSRYENEKSGLWHEFGRPTSYDANLRAQYWAQTALEPLLTGNLKINCGWAQTVGMCTGCCTSIDSICSKMPKLNEIMEWKYPFNK